jgi:hypothetical protein
MVVAVLPSLEKSQVVLSAWEAFGVTGITILESIGLHKLRQLRAQRDDVPLFPSLRHLLEEEEYHHRTIFVVVDDAFDLEGLIRVTEKAVGGNFNAPNSGLLFVMPVTRVLGLRPHWTRERK